MLPPPGFHGCLSWLGIHVGGPLCFSSCILQRRLSTQLAVGTYFAYIAAYDILSPDRYQIRNHLRTAYILFGYLHPQTSLSTPIPQDLLLFVYSRLVPKLGIRLNPKAISLLSTQNWQAWSHNLSHPTLKLASTQAKNLPVISNFDKKPTQSKPMFSCKGVGCIILNRSSAGGYTLRNPQLSALRM